MSGKNYGCVIENLIYVSVLCLLRVEIKKIISRLKKDIFKKIFLATRIDVSFLKNEYFLKRFRKIYIMKIMMQCIKT